MKKPQTLVLALVLAFSFSAAAEESNGDPWKPWIEKWASQSYLRTMVKTNLVKPDVSETEQVIAGSPVPRLHQTYKFSFQGKAYEVTQFAPQKNVQSSPERDQGILDSIRSLISARKQDELLFIWTGANHTEHFFTEDVIEPTRGVYYASNGIPKSVLLLDDANARVTANAVDEAPKYDNTLLRDATMLGLIAQAQVYVEIYAQVAARRKQNIAYVTNEALWKADDKTAPTTIFLSDYHNLFGAPAIQALPKGEELKASGVKSVRIGLEGFVSEKEVSLEDLKKHSTVTGPALSKDLRALSEAIKQKADSPAEQKVAAAQIAVIDDLVTKYEKQQLFVSGSLWALVKKIEEWKASNIDVSLVGIDTETARTFGAPK